MTSNLKAQERNGQSNKQLRKSGFVPCSMYGKSLEATQIQIPQQTLQKCLKQGSPKVNIEFNGQTYLASIEEAQTEPASSNLLHVSFHAFNQNEKVSMDVPVKITGKAIGQTDGGILQTQIQTVCVYGPASQLPEAIEVDVSKLQLGSSIHVSDLASSSKWEIKESPDKVLVSCNYPKLHKVEDEPQVESVEAPAAEQEGEAPVAEKQAA